MIIKRGALASLALDGGLAKAFHHISSFSMISRFGGPIDDY
jgi:hypothetical protein